MRHVPAKEQQHGRGGQGQQQIAHQGKDQLRFHRVHRKQVLAGRRLSIRITRSANNDHQPRFSMSNILDRIVAAKRQEIRAMPGACFRRASWRAGWHRRRRCAIFARRCCRAGPGHHRRGEEGVAVGRRAAGRFRSGRHRPHLCGATAPRAISVLTDEPFFQGRLVVSGGRSPGRVARRCCARISFSTAINCWKRGPPGPTPCC